MIEALLIVGGLAVLAGAVWWMLRGPGGGDDGPDEPMRFGGGGKR